MVDGIRTASLEDKLLLNVIMRSLICNGARTRLDYKVDHSFFFVCATVGLGLSPQNVQNTRGA